MVQVWVFAHIGILGATPRLVSSCIIDDDAVYRALILVQNTP